MFLSNKLNIYFIIVPILGLLLLGINYFLSTSNSYSEKDGPFECGFTSFSQSRSAFSVAFILIAILFLPFDLEISSILPYVISIYNNNLYGLLILYSFLIILIIGFIFEINKHALYIIKYFNFKINDLYRNLN